MQAFSYQCSARSVRPRVRVPDQRVDLRGTGPDPLAWPAIRLAGRNGSFEQRRCYVTTRNRSASSGCSEAKTLSSSANARRREDRATTDFSSCVEELSFEAVALAADANYATEVGASVKPRRGDPPRTLRFND